ncbi:MAG: hypothetical protein ABSF77_04745 [Spirochaetia bacterium]
MRNVTVRVENRRLSAERTSRLVLGNFMELGLGRQAAGMWAEMLYNRGFHPIPPAAPIVWEWLRFSPDRYNAQAPFWHSGYEEIDWEPLPGSGAEMERIRGFEPFKGNDSLGVRNTRPGIETGIRQRGIVLHRGKRYVFQLFGGFQGRKTTVPEGLFDPARDKPPETREVAVTLRSESAPDNIIARITLSLTATQGLHEQELDAGDFSGRAILEISFHWEGVLMLSSCSLMPADAVGGWRSDVVELLRRVSPPLMRFPGGCFASFYDWRDGIGPRALRPPREPYFWGGLEENDVGIDEFLALCGVLGCEPQICVNMMTGSPQAAAELVQYCNGLDSSPMGRVRKEHGVHRKGRVRFWEMENEAGRKWSAPQYAEKVAQFARRMREVDPRIVIMMEYYSWGLDWLPRMLEIAGKDVDVVIHRDADPGFMASALSVVQEFNARHGTSIRQANTEWLPDFDSPQPLEDPEVPRTYNWEPSGNDYRKTLSYRQIRWFYALNAASRIIDYLSYGGGFALANFNNCVNTWGQNIIESAKEGAWLSPAGRVFEFFHLFRDAYPLATSCDPEDRALLNLQACEPQPGEIDLYAVNKDSDHIELSLSMPAGFTAQEVRSLSAEQRLVTNRLSEDRIQSSSAPAGDAIALTPFSLTHVSFRR